MIIRATEWMSGRWWAALAIVMAFILVARTGTVGAPAEARIADRADRPMTRRFGDIDARRATQYETTVRDSQRADLSLERHVRYLEGELATLQAQLQFERERAEILEAGYEVLDAKFDDVTDSVRGLVEADARDVDLVPQPIEAIYVRGLEESTASQTSQER